MKMKFVSSKDGLSLIPTTVYSNVLCYFKNNASDKNEIWEVKTVVPNSGDTIFYVLRYPLK